MQIIAVTIFSNSLRRQKWYSNATSHNHAIAMHYTDTLAYNISLNGLMHCHSQQNHSQPSRKRDTNGIIIDEDENND